MRPGVNVATFTTAPTRTFPSDTGTAFIPGLAEKGPTDRAVLVRSMREFTRIFGKRVSYGYLYDACDIYFALGGTQVYVARVVGPAATPDAVTLDDAGAAPSLRVETPGENESTLTAEVVAGSVAGTFVLVIADTALGEELERSPDLADTDAAVAWSTRSNYVKVVKLGANDPAVAAATPLAGGADDRAAITDTERAAALDLFPRDLGPGQVYYPGATTTAMHSALLTHAETRNRFAILDATDTPTRTIVLAQVTAQRSAAGVNPSHGILVGPWATVTGAQRNTTRTVPYSIIQGGLVARLDGLTGNPNLAAAGSEGEAPMVISLTQTYSDADHEALNAGGVVIAKMVYGRCRTYGWRTMADEAAADYDGFLEASAARLRMAITGRLLTGGEEFAFDQIDGAGQKISEFDSYARGVMDEYLAMGAVYGESAREAYTIDTGSSVNTPETILDRQLNVNIGMKTSPFAEEVNFLVSRVPINQSL